MGLGGFSSTCGTWASAQTAPAARPPHEGHRRSACTGPLCPPPAGSCRLGLAHKEPSVWDSRWPGTRTAPLCPAGGGPTWGGASKEAVRLRLGRPASLATLCWARALTRDSALRAAPHHCPLHVQRAELCPWLGAPRPHTWSPARVCPRQTGLAGLQRGMATLGTESEKAGEGTWSGTVYSCSRCHSALPPSLTPALVTTSLGPSGSLAPVRGHSLPQPFTPLVVINRLHGPCTPWWTRWSPPLGGGHAR